MKIITANIGIGVPRMDEIGRNIRTHVAFHGWKVIPFMLFKETAVTHLDLSSCPDSGRVAYCDRESDLSNTLAMLSAERPDVVALQEVLEQRHLPLLEDWFNRNGYASYELKRARHHADEWVSVVIGSREHGLPLDVDMPQSARMGGGGGIAGMVVGNFSFITAHLTHGDQEETKAQLDALAAIMKREAARGRSAVLMGDFNLSLEALHEHGILADTGSVSVPTDVTCPTCLPRRFQQKLDHVIVPAVLRGVGETIHYGSDHAAIRVEIC